MAAGRGSCRLRQLGGGTMRRGGAGRRAANRPAPQQQRAISIAYQRAAAARLGEPGGGRANGAALCKWLPPVARAELPPAAQWGSGAISERRNGAVSRFQGAVNAFKFKAQPPRPATVGAARDAGRPRQGQGKAGQGSPAPPQRPAYPQRGEPRPALGRLTQQPQGLPHRVGRDALPLAQHPPFSQLENCWGVRVGKDRRKSLLWFLLR